MYCNERSQKKQKRQIITIAAVIVIRNCITNTDDRYKRKQLINWLEPQRPIKKHFSSKNILHRKTENEILGNDTYKR